jgi:DNA invertase Pin-like site-specific DNA recombinase
MSYVAYYRVSTQRQGQSGLGLEAQQAAVKAFTKDQAIIAEFTEIESGRKNNRPQLAQALALAKKHKATLVIAKLDRLARNVHFISGLLESNVQFIAADMPEADRTFLQMAAVFAEWEAKKISERTKSALQMAKARGTKLGSPAPQNGSKAGLNAIQSRVDSYVMQMAPVIKEFIGMDLRSVAQVLSQRGFKTPRGNTQWHPSQVGTLMRKVQYA